MHLTPVTIDGRTLRLEPLEQQHANDLMQASDPDIFTYFWLASPSKWSEDGFHAYVTALLDLPGWYFMAMVHQESGRAIGLSSYNDVRPEHRGLEIGGTWIARSFQGTHINPECKYLMLRHAFENLGAIRVQLKTDRRNLQSQRALEKLGAIREGVLRHHILLPDGYKRDTVMYSITDDEWPQVRSRLADRLGYVP